MNIPSLASMMESLSMSDRAAMAVAHQIDERDIENLVYNRTLWSHSVARMLRPVQAVIARMRRSAGVLPATLVEAIAGPLRTSLESISPRAFLTIHHPLTPLEQLFVSGVVWPHTTSSGRYWVIPKEIEESLGDVPALFDAEQPQPACTPALPPSLDDVLVAATMLALDGRLPLQHHGRISQVVLNRLGQDGISLTMLQWMTSCWLSAGVFRVDTQGLAPTPRLMEWLSMAPHERTQEMARAWLQAAWNEWEMAHLKKRPPAVDVRYARRMVAHALLSHLPEEWCAWDAIHTSLRSGWPDMVRPTNQQGKWQTPAGWPHTWLEEDGRLIECMLRGPACWLGIVVWDELGVYVRRTALGGWLAGVNPTPTSPSPQPARLEADGSVVLVDTTNYYARVQLYRIADWRDTLTAQITPNRVRQAIAGGMSSATYLDILQSVIDEPIPTAFASMIRAWADDVSHVSVESMVLIKANSADVTMDIIHDRQVALTTYQRVNDTTLAIAPNVAATIIRRLRQAGYVVDVIGIKVPQFDDVELAVLEQMLRTLHNPDEQVRQIQAKIAQIRRKGQTNG